MASSDEEELQTELALGIILRRRRCRATKNHNDVHGYDLFYRKGSNKEIITISHEK